MAETFRMPLVFTFSRKTGELIGTEYVDLDAETVARFGARLARALDTGKQLDALERANREGGETDVTFSESAGSC